MLEVSNIRGGTSRKMTTIIEYSPVFGEKLIKFSKNGGSITAFRGEENIPKAIWNKWCEDKPEFQESVDLAKCCQMAFYEKIMNEALQASSLNDYGENNGMTEKERAFLARDRLNHLDAQNLKTNGESLSAPKKEWEDREETDLRERQGNDTGLDAMAEFN